MYVDNEMKKFTARYECEGKLQFVSTISSARLGIHDYMYRKIQRATCNVSSFFGSLGGYLKVELKNFQFFAKKKRKKKKTYVRLVIDHSVEL